MEPHLPRLKGRIGARIAGGCFLLLTAVWAVLFSRAALFFVVDPIPAWVNSALLFGWLTFFILLLVPTGWLWNFALDRKARYVIAVSFLFWLITETLHAALFGTAHHFLTEGNGMNSMPPIIWQLWELALVFPFLVPLWEDAYLFALMIEGALMKNSLLMRFVLYCIYWPAVIALEGTAFFTLVFYFFRGIVRFCRFLKQHLTRNAPDNESALKNQSMPDNQNVSGNSEPATGDGEPVLSASIGNGPGQARFYAVFSVLLLAALAGWWSCFIAENYRQCRVWNQDFHSARILLSRFAAENFRHPYSWDEITESSRFHQPGGENFLEKGEHYYKNPGLKDRIELNFDHLKRVDAGTSYPSEEWIFRIAAASSANPTGEAEPFEWAAWQGMLANLLAVNLFGFGSPEQKPAEQGSSEQTADPVL